MLTPFIVALLTLLIAQQVIDWWSTSRVLAAGGREKNKLEVWLMARFGSVDRALVVKGLGVVLIGVIIALTCPPAAALFFIGLIVAAYLYAVINNLLVMRKMGLL